MARCGPGITDAKAEALVDVLKTVDDLELKATLRFIIAAVQASRGAALAPGQRDALRRAAETKGHGIRTSTTLKPMLNLLNYAGDVPLLLEKKVMLVKALDEANVHGQDVALIDYDVFIAKDTPDHVTAVVAAAEAAGCPVTVEKVEALAAAIGKQSQEGLRNCEAKPMLEVLAALLRASPCDGRALENEEDVATACIAAGFTNLEVLSALKHLLEPLKHEDGPKPRKPAKAKIWDERRVVARRVADLLHDMRIHMKNVPFASYAAVQKKWKKKYDALEASSSDSEPEPEPKRPKRSCRTPADE